MDRKQAVKLLCAMQLAHRSCEAVTQQAARDAGLPYDSGTAWWADSDAAAACVLHVALPAALAGSTVTAAELQRQHRAVKKRIDDSDASGPSANEYRLVLELAAEPPANFPYLVAYEWCDSNGGKGDLVFTDDTGLAFAVVEVKHLNLDKAGHTTREARRRARQKVKRQAGRYADAFRTSSDTALLVLPATFTNEDGLEWLGRGAAMIDVWQQEVAKARRQRQRLSRPPPAVPLTTARRHVYVSSSSDDSDNDSSDDSDGDLVATKRASSSASSSSSWGLLAIGGAALAFLGAAAAAYAASSSSAGSGASSSSSASTGRRENR